jgi:NitT/TauT family transport system substrate-binding protein
VPFLANKTSAQQGYITSETFALEKQGGFKPVVFVLAYATTIETKKELVEKNPDLVPRFKGWYSYLKNSQPANQLIKKDNPEMTDEQLAYGLQKLNQYGIIVSEAAKTQGIGSMSEQQWRSLFDNMVNVLNFELV